MEPNEAAEYDDNFVEVKKVPWSTNEKNANRKIIDELTAASTENERLFFNLQQQLKLSDQLKGELENAKTTITTQAEQLAKVNAEANDLNDEIHELSQELKSVQSAASLSKLEYDEGCSRLRSEIAKQKDEIKALHRANKNLQARLEQIERSGPTTSTPIMPKLTLIPIELLKATPVSTSNSSSARGKCLDATRTATATPTQASHTPPAQSIVKRRVPAKPKAKKKRVEKNNVYEVEKILDHRSKKDGKIFLIRWKGYDSEDDTWEKEADLSCRQLLTQYFASIDKKK